MKKRPAKKVPKKAPVKLSPDEMAKALHAKHEEVSNAIQGVLTAAGLHGVSVHSVRFTVAPEMMSGSPCDPACGPNETCVSSGGVWVCVPD